MITAPVHEEIFVVGLAGPSGSGKSTVAKSVASRLNGHVISMELYALEMNHLPLEERAKQNYDAPNAIDVQLLENHIHAYAAGHAIEAPIYDFAQHLRVHDQHEHIAAKSLLIVEGILALHFAQLRPHFDLSIYLDAPEEVCFHRRKVRDITERRREEPLRRHRGEARSRRRAANLRCREGQIKSLSHLCFRRPESSLVLH
jgi:uridine kinase